MTENNFLLIELSDKNRFSVILSGDLDMQNSSVINQVAILDIGCTSSSLPYYRIVPDSAYANFKKQLDIKKNRDFELSYGVETGGFTHDIPKTFDEKMKCAALKFKHNMSDFSLNNYNIGTQDVYVNYNRRGNILIGMDILKQFDFYIGLSHITSTIVFIGVLREQKDKSGYYTALKEHFGLAESQSFFADLFRNFRR